MKRLISFVSFFLFASIALAEPIVPNATTSKCFRVQVKDSTVTTGAGKTGLAFNTAGLTCYFSEDGQAGSTAITLATSTLGTYTSGAFKEVDATNMPGWYEFCPPNAALDGGIGKAVVFNCKGAAGMAQMDLRVLLSPPVDMQAINSSLTSGNNATLSLKQLNVNNSTGDAIVASSSGSNGNGINASGNGTGAGIKGTAGATGNGISAVGGATSGSAFKASGTAGNAIGIDAVGQGSAQGIKATGGATGVGITAAGGSTSGAGFAATSTTGDTITSVASAGNGNALKLTGNGTGAGLSLVAGATGNGLLSIGGATSGSAIKATGTAGNANALELAGQGSASGLSATGGATGNGISAVGGSTSGNGINATVTSGNPINGNITANITGNLSGSVGSVTGNVGGNVTGSVGSVTGNVGGNVTGSVGSVASGGITSSSFGSGAITATSIASDAITAAKIADGAIDAATYASDLAQHQNTAQSVTSNTLRMASSETYGDNALADHNSVAVMSSTNGLWQVRCIKSNVASTDTLTLTEPWKILPTGTIKYSILHTPNCNIAKWPVAR